MTRELHRCDHEGCPARATWGFKWGIQERHYCLEHSDEGRAWHDGIKSAGAAPERQEADAGRLL